MQQFSHLFPAHLYVKKKTAGQEIDHNEDLVVDGSVMGDNASSLAVKPSTAGVLLFDHESKVQIGHETTTSSYDRMPVD